MVELSLKRVTLEASVGLGRQDWRPGSQEERGRYKRIGPKWKRSEVSQDQEE